jgi:diguanylate cyclase (GGDEF)-like protein/PAS domain S-box-containing protein
MQIKLQSVSIGLRIGLALALPILGMLAFSAWPLLNSFQSVRELNGLRKMAELVPAVSALVHELQHERGLSAGLSAGRPTDLSGFDKAFAKRLPNQQSATDRQRAAFSDLLKSFEHAPASANARSKHLSSRIDTARTQLDRLDAIRQSVAVRSINASEITRYYTGAISELIDITDEMLLVNTHADLTGGISAYIRLLQLKEHIGQERAIGVPAFVAGHIDAVGHTRLIELIDRQRTYLHEFNFYATPQQVQQLEQINTSRRQTEILRLRQIALASLKTGSTEGTDASLWFDLMTEKINQLREIEIQVGHDLIAAATALEENASRIALRISLLVVTLLGVTILLAAALARGIIHPLQDMTQSLKRLADGDQSTAITGDDRGDEIGALAHAAAVFRNTQMQISHADEQMRIATALRVHHKALSAISQGVLITDMGRRPIYSNLAFNTMFALAAADFPESVAAPLGSPNSITHSLTGLAETFGDAHVLREQRVELQRSDGSPFWCSITVMPVLDAVDQPTHLVGVLRDITDSRRIEQELRISATAFESLHGMIVTDAKGIILRVNNAFIEMTGYSADEAVGQTPQLLKSGRHEPEFYTDMWRQLAVTGAWSGEIWDRRKSGEIYPKWQTISAVRGTDGAISHYVAAFSDISERKAAEQRIHDLAFYDPLTALPNRRLLIDRLHHALAASARNGSHGALLFIDLDNFKNLNDTRGHDMGDLLLIEVAERLKACLRGCDTAARLGGDEFVVMLEDLSETAPEAGSEAESVGEKILAALNISYDLAGKPHRSTPSIGVTLYRGQDTSIDELLKQADLAMYQSKASGRNAMRFFDPAMQAVVSARSLLEAELRQALDQEQFVLHYQPQVDHMGCVTGAEALVRWQHPERGMVSPVEFILAAEETGLIIPLGQWVLKTACERLADWGRHPSTADLTMAVNVSARQFRHADFVTQVITHIEQSGANPHHLKLELTESLLLDDIENTVVKMTSLKTYGISFSLDDFGTGYSSLAYLKRLPIDQLKIDRSFIHDVLNDPNDAVIAKAIIALGQSLGLSVIAEGVETQGQHDFLTTNQCQAFQGYLFGRPEK